MGLLDQAHSRRVVIKGALKGTTYAAPVVLSTAVPRLVAAVSPPAPTGADLALTLAAAAATPGVGDRVSRTTNGPAAATDDRITLTLTNNGPAAATGVVVTDILPSGLTFVSATPSQGAYDPATGLWSVGALAVGGTAILTLTVTVTAPATDTATITHSDQPDPNPANNTATLTLTPGASADLALTKNVDLPTPTVTESVTFTVTVSNTGPSAATGVTVTDLLPAGLTFASAAASQGTYSSATGVWSVGTVAVGGGATLAIRATVTSGATLTNTATITHSDQPDPNTANNTATATVTPQHADLALTKTVDNAAPNVGDTVTFTVTLSNTGPSAATGVRVSDALPAGIVFISSTPSQGTYSSATSVWTVGSVANGATATLAIAARVVSAIALTNIATITDSDQVDPNTANNIASARVTPQQADLVLTKTVNTITVPVSFPVSFPITYTVTLSNNGPSAATGVTVTDFLPAGLTFSSSTQSQGAYNSTTGAWTVGSVANGAIATLTITAALLEFGTLTNTATVSHSDQFDPNAANNTASVTIGQPI